MRYYANHSDAGHAERATIEADSPREAAQEFGDSGSWPSLAPGETATIRVTVWSRLDCEGRRADDEEFRITITG